MHVGVPSSAQLSKGVLVHVHKCFIDSWDDWPVDLFSGSHNMHPFELYELLGCYLREEWHTICLGPEPVNMWARLSASLVPCSSGYKPAISHKLLTFLKYP